MKQSDTEKYIKMCMKNHINKRLIMLISFGIFVISVVDAKNIKTDNPSVFKPWKDTSGNTINAHGAGILFHNNMYYWYGELKGDSTYRYDKISTWECYRTEAGGVSCYSSKDLTHWQYKGIALQTVTADSSHVLHPSQVVERPKVIYNDKTKKFVMWMHVDCPDYSKAACGVATSSNPTGPFTYLNTIHPLGNDSRDMTLFKDDDGCAYQISSSENNSTLHIYLLDDSYLNPTQNYIQIFKNKYREAPAVFKRKGKYYMITSGCTGWSPNEAGYAVADSMLGSWKVKGNPCVGEGAQNTFGGQSTYVLPVAGKKEKYIALFDQWNKMDLDDSRYLWLPIEFKGEEIKISLSSSQ
jgi:beta-xylosidase